MRSSRLTGVLAVAVLLTGACGDGGTPSEAGPRSLVSSTAPSPTGATGATSSGPAVEAADEPQAAYLAWLAALESQDAEAACERHHPDLTIALRYEAILLDRAELGDPCTGFVALLWEDPLREVDPVEVETTQDTGEKATVAARFEGGSETAQLVYHRAQWRVLSTASRVEATEGATADAPQRWVRAWCDLEVGADRAAVVEQMGEPSGEYTITNGGEPQLWWAQDQYDFRAYLDARGRVLDLVGDYDALGAADRQQLDCPELR